MKIRTYNEGLDDAVAILRNTANDLESSFERRGKDILRGIRSVALGKSFSGHTIAMQRALDTDKEKVSLLRGQVVHILLMREK